VHTEDESPVRWGDRWHWPDGTSLPVVGGGDGPPDPPAPPAAPPAPPAPPPSDRTFTQADLDKIAGESRDSGRKAAEKALLDALGVTDVEAAKTALAAAKAAEDAQKTELQRATEERDRLKAEAERAQALAATTLAGAKIEGALRDAGINPARIEAALKLVDHSAVKVEGLAVEGVAEAVAALKAATPEWFGSSRAPETGGPPPSAQDFRTASPDELAREFARYGIRL